MRRAFFLLAIVEILIIKLGPAVWKWSSSQTDNFMHHNSRSPKVIGLIDRQRPRNWIALFCGWNGWNRHFVCLKIEAETLICLFLFLGVGQVFLLAYDVQRAWNKEQSCMWWSRKSDLCSRTGSIVSCSLADCHRLSAELCYCRWREINKRRSVLVGGGHGGGRRRERLPVPQYRSAGLKFAPRRIYINTESPGGESVSIQIRRGANNKSPPLK